MVLVVTGVYLTLFFDPSYALMRYHGSYRPLAGASMSHAYASTLRLSLNVRAGLLMRQTHHWAALVFVAAIVMHLCRVFFTGAFRRPRELIWITGVTLLALAMLEGFIGYSLPDDLLSGMGLAIAYSVAMSIPIVGAPLAFLIWNGPFPGGTEFESRLYIVHVLLIPAALGGADRAAPGDGRGAPPHAVSGPRPAGVERRRLAACGRRTRSVPWAFSGVAGTLVLLGGLVQINPVRHTGLQPGPHRRTNLGHLVVDRRRLHERLRQGAGSSVASCSSRATALLYTWSKSASVASGGMKVFEIRVTR